MGVRLAGSEALITLQKKGVLLKAGDILKARKWFEIKQKDASSSALSDVVPSGYGFKTGGTDVTLVGNDKVYALSFLKLCKVNCNISFEKGTVDVTTDCDDGYDTFKSTGYRNMSGDFSGMFETDPENPNGMFESQKALMDDFYDTIKDDGDNNYSFSPARDTIFRIWILKNSKEVGTMHHNIFLSVPIILTTQATGMELKSGQTFDCSFQKGEGPIYQYIRKIDTSQAFDWQNLETDPLDGGDTSDDYTEL